MKVSFLANNMRKALAQNPNLLRTLIGLGLTLIVLLSYAVYGATISPDYYIYSSKENRSIVDLGTAEPFYDEDSNTTTWLWSGDMISANLSWVNLTVEDLSQLAEVRISNAGGLFSHPDLGNPDANRFSCATSCSNKTSHFATEKGGSVAIYSLSDPDPALRGKGTVFAKSLNEAEQKAKDIIFRDHQPISVQITIVEQGNRSTTPDVNLQIVNEQYDSIKPFQIDAATEMMWALAAVIGCFSMVLIPSFTVYFAARAKQKRVDLALDKAQLILDEEN